METRRYLSINTLEKTTPAKSVVCKPKYSLSQSFHVIVSNIYI